MANIKHTQTTEFFLLELYLDVVYGNLLVTATASYIKVLCPMFCEVQGVGRGMGSPNGLPLCSVPHIHSTEFQIDSCSWFFL